MSDKVNEARRIHAMDQTKGALKDVAEMVVYYADRLEEAGFSREEAVTASDAISVMLLETVFFDGE